MSRTDEENEISANKIESVKNLDQKAAGLRSPVRDIFPQIATDQWTIEDQLNIHVYTDTLLKFLSSPETKAPLSISIQAPWDGGKTSFMKMVQYELDRHETPLPELYYPRKSNPIESSFRELINLSRLRKKSRESHQKSQY